MRCYRQSLLTLPWLKKRITNTGNEKQKEKENKNEVKLSVCLNWSYQFEHMVLLCMFTVKSTEHAWLCVTVSSPLYQKGQGTVRIWECEKWLSTQMCSKGRNQVALEIWLDREVWTEPKTFCHICKKVYHRGMTGSWQVKASLRAILC